MINQLVKKSRTDRRKRKGYQGTKWDTAKRFAKDHYGKAATIGMAGWNASDIYGILQHMGLFKHGGRVRGVGKATHGYGRAMRKRK